jgi:hypothetical protein
MRGEVGIAAQLSYARSALLLDKLPKLTPEQAIARFGRPLLRHSSVKSQ